MATLQFKPTDWGYELIAKEVTTEPLEIHVSPPKLTARIKNVRDAMLRAVQKNSVATAMKLSDADNTAFLEELAFSGFRLFQTVFAGPKASEGLLEVSRWLRESLSGDVTTLQVTSDGFPVPWAAMYLTDRFDAAPRSWDRFIGMRHVVEQIPLTQTNPVLPEVTIQSAPELTVRTLYNDGIDAKMPSKPIVAQRDYWARRGVAVTEGTTVDDLVIRALSATATDKLLYLFCHAKADDADSDASKLILTGSKSVTLGKLWVHAPRDDQLASHPLVFINACESADMTPNFYDGFVEYFLAKGARGIIGTECKTGPVRERMGQGLLR